MAHRPVPWYKPSFTLRQLLFVLVVGLGVLMVSGRCGTHSPSSDPTAPDATKSAATRITADDRRLAAWVACNLATESFLKAPSTADWPAENQMHAIVIKNRVSFPTAYVDSENSFGAMVRSSVFCATEGRGDQVADYRVIRLRIDGVVVINHVK